jgi:acyl-CoA synthetase (AMP-forming)/AMP-acid ligase II
VYSLVASWVNRASNAVALCAPGRAPLTYARLLYQMRGVVAHLNELGLGRNDRIAICIPNGPESAAAFLTISAGATCAPLSTTWRPIEYEAYLREARAQALVIQSGLASPAVSAAQGLGIPVIELSPLLDEPAGVFSLKGKGGSRAPQTGCAPGTWLWCCPRPAQPPGRKSSR